MVPAWIEPSGQLVFYIGKTDNKTAAEIRVCVISISVTNLQGIWNGVFTAPWNGSYTFDTNVQNAMDSALSANTELERLRPPKEKALLLEQSVEVDQVEPVMPSGRTLYLFPDGLASQRPYLLLVEAMQRRTCCAVGRITMSGRRYAVAVRPLRRLLAMHVLHDPALVRPAATLEADLRDSAASAEELNLACTLIDSASGPLDWTRLRDDTPEKLMQLIEAKLEGRQVPVAEEEPVQVLQLLDALKQSVAQATGKKGSSDIPTRARKRRSA